MTEEDRTFEKLDERSTNRHAGVREGRGATTMMSISKIATTMAGVPCQLMRKVVGKRTTIVGDVVHPRGRGGREEATSL